MLDAMLKTSENPSNNKDKQMFRIKTKRRDLVKCLSHVQTIVEKRNIIAILSNLLLRAEKGKLTVTATDMDIVFSEQIEVEVLEAGAITVSAHLLYDIVRKLDDDANIELSLRDNATIDILSSNCKFSLGTLPAKEFPKLQDDGYSIEFAISSVLLREVIDKVKFSISTEETRYNLNGMMLHSEANGELKAVSTDGHRLSVMTLSKLEGVKAFDSVIIPRKAITEIRKAIDEFEGEINIAISQNKARFSSKDFVMITKLIDAKFPSYEALVPTDNELKIIINREAFIKAIDRVSTINNEKFRGIRLTFNGDRLVLASVAGASGSAEEALKLPKEVPGELKIGFNSRYLFEVMSVLDGNEIACYFKDQFSPAILSETSNENYRHILMPVHI